MADARFERLKLALNQLYHIEREIGRGAMATVFLAEDVKHHRPVAVKVLNPEVAAALGAERFLREIEVSARLHHPHILPLYDSGDAEGFLYYVMPYVEGESLRERLAREKQLPLDDALRIAHEVADALSYAHSRGIVHRDIKPENILLESSHAMVADFGIARALTAGGDRLTATGLAIGTPAYMSPEQATGDEVVDGRSDLYALGCVLYEMLAGQPPFTGPTVESILSQHLAAEPPHVTSLRPAVPAPVAGAIQRALAKTPADRFNAVAVFSETLGGAQFQRPLAAVRAAKLPEVSAPERPARLSRKVLLPAGSVLLLFAVTVLAWLVFGNRTPALTESRASSIAVLPFADLSPGREDEYFADGMAEEILNALAQVPGLKVAARTSAFSFKGKEEDARVIGERLGVETVLEGSVRRDGPRVRITAQLVNAADGLHLWSGTYEREGMGVFAMQDEIAGAVLSALKHHLGADPGTPLAEAPTRDLAAYEEYLRGRFQWAKRTPEGVSAAIQRFERAIALDSAFVLAYSGLADAYAVLPWWDPDAVPTEAHSKSRQAAETAVSLDARSPEARTSLGYAILMEQWDFDAAERELRRAIELHPQYEAAYHWLADVLSYRGMLAEAIGAERRALEFDPLSIVSTQNLAHLLKFDRQYQAAMAQAERTLDLDRTRPDTWFQIAYIRILADRTDEAGRALARWAELVGADPQVFGRLPGLVAQHRRTGEPVRLPSELDTTSQLGMMDRARLYALGGDADRALDLLERLVRQRWPQALELPIDPAFETLGNDPRFSSLLQSMSRPNRDST
jgi:eukaryotic-like serine/threonine-protein kinase